MSMSKRPRSTSRTRKWPRLMNSVVNATIVTRTRDSSGRMSGGNDGMRGAADADSILLVVAFDMISQQRRWSFLIMRMLPEFIPNITTWWYFHNSNTPSRIPGNGLDEWTVGISFGASTSRAAV